MQYDLYPILIDELLSIYDLHGLDNNINILYKYVYIKCSINNDKKIVSARDLILFILSELNISTLTDNEEGKSTLPYVIYKDVKYYNHQWSSEFLDNFRFRADLEGEMNVKAILDKVYIKGYRKANKYKGLHDYKDYIKYYRLMTLNEAMNVTISYSMGVDGFTNSVNHNPYKRSTEETLEAKLQSGKLLGSRTTSHITESQLEDYLVDNIEEVEAGMTYVNRQVEVSGGITDIIARDKDNVICVIEIKINEDKSLIWQVLHYPPEIKKKYSVNNVRMITVAPKYSNHIKKALQSLDCVELMEYNIEVSGENIVNLSVNKV